MFAEKSRYGQNPNIVVRSATSTFNAPLKWAIVHVGKVQGEKVNRGRCSGCKEILEIHFHVIVPSTLTEAALKTLQNQNR